MFGVKTISKNIRKNGLPQAHGLFFEYDEPGDYKNRKVIRACAIGMAAHNLEVEPLVVIESLNKNNRGMTKCPEGHILEIWQQNLASVITHLNDKHSWTFEQIADWLDKRYA